MNETAKYRALLEERQAELEARLREIDEELDSHQSKDWEELATEREGDEVLEHEGALGKAEIAKIQAAFTRMDEGEFGFCVKCGNEIAEERLDVVPHTPFCRNCAP
jgi:RNA polymerase-binding transcription factor DksA